MQLLKLNLFKRTTLYKVMTNYDNYYFKKINFIYFTINFNQWLHKIINCNPILTKQVSLKLLVLIKMLAKM